MKKQAKQEKKKEEEDFKRSEFEVSIIVEHFLTFTLNLTQQILDIKKDKASDKKIKNILRLISKC